MLATGGGNEYLADTAGGGTDAAGGGSEELNTTGEGFLRSLAAEGEGFLKAAGEGFLRLVSGGVVSTALTGAGNGDGGVSRRAMFFLMVGRGGGNLGVMAVMLDTVI